MCQVIMKEDLLRVARSFHDAFYEAEKNSFKFQLFSHFPQSCCEFSSLLLALFLKKHWDIREKIHVLYGVNKDDAYERHVWLRVSSVNIDITAKQFDQNLPSFLITFERQEGWHDRYFIDKDNEFCLDFSENYKEAGRIRLMDDYYSLEKIALLKLVRE